MAYFGLKMRCGGFLFRHAAVAAAEPSDREHVMDDRYYLLSLEEFEDAACGERLFAEAFRRIDSARQLRAERIRPVRARQACVGAGLLLQTALEEAEKGTPGKGRELTVCTVSRLLESIAEPREIVMKYEKNGKPYMRDYPFFFNLSHSGGYVFCVLSEREAGADIQRCSPADYGRLAGRFFSEEERLALDGCAGEGERRRLFYRLWTRKEAFGKLTGEGIAAALGENLLPGAGSGNIPGVCFREWDRPQGYRIAVCQYDRSVKGMDEE